MFKKTISHIWIYLIIFNLFSSVLFIDNVYSINLVPNIKKQVSENKKNYSEDRLIVKFKSNSWLNTVSDVENVIHWIWVSNVKFYNKLGIWVVWFNNKTKNIETLKNDLNNLSNVEYVEYDYLRDLNYTWVDTNDTQSIDQWYLKSIQADEAWKIYNDNENKTIVSVNDTWLDYWHPDLSWNLKDLTINCLSDTWSIISWWCPNSGWNFEWSWDYNPLTAVLEENETYDLNGHWTHVAWTIWAVWNNGTWVIWVTQNAEIMWARIETYSNDYVLFYVSNAIRALDFARENWAKVVNASYWGWGYSQAEYDAIEVAKNAWILFVAAAWNSTNNNDGGVHFYPSDYDLDNIISVASIWEDDELAYYSNYWATSVDVAAPGWDMSEDTWILATYPFFETIWSHNLNTFSGITLGWTWLDWNIVQWLAIESQSWSFDWATTYTWSEDKTLTFDETFDLSGAKFAKFQWYFECELQAWDNLEVLINNQVIWNAYPYWNYARASNYWNVILPIPSNLYSAWSELKIRFSTNSDTNYDYWCTLDNFSIVKHDVTKHTYKSIHWTSMAAPVVSWVASMIWSYKPELSYAEVKDIIFSSLDTLPILAWKVLTSWKVNAKNAIKELISRYWITKNGSFEWENFNTPVINLGWKNISLSWSVIAITSTGSAITLNWSTVGWNWIIEVWTWVSINNFSTDSDFNIILKDASWTTLNNFDTIYGESLIMSHIGSFTWSTINLQLQSWTWELYNGLYSENQTISINDSFSWSINSYVFKNWYLSEWIGSGVILELLDTETLSNINFVYTPSLFTWSMFNYNNCDEVSELLWLCSTISTSTWTYVWLDSTHYPVDYEISWDVVWVYTWTLNSAQQISIELTPWDWEKTLSGVLENLASQFSNIFTWSIVLDQTAPSVVVLANTSTWTSVQYIEFNISSWDIDFDTWSIVWSNNLNLNTGTGLTYEVSWETSTALIATASFSDIAGNTWSIDSETYIIDNTGPDAPTNLFLNDGWIINVSNVTNLSLSWSGIITESWATINYSFEDVLAWVVGWTGLLSWENFIFPSLNLSSLSDGPVVYSTYFIDIAWNTGSIASWSTTKETIIPTWSISLLNITNNTWALVNLTSSEYPVDYELAWDIIWTITWTLVNSWSISVELTSSDWLKNISVIFTDLWNNSSSTYTWSIVLDQTLPVLNILSHSDNEEIQSWIITLTWTVSDINGLDSLIINWIGVSILSGEYSTNISVSSWDNAVDYILTDNAWNILTGSINLVWINTDSIPDSFVFTDITNAVLSTEYISNAITISWINTWSIVSVSNGLYSINSWEYTNSGWLINSWDNIKIKLISSSTYLTKVDSTLTIGWVSDIYSVTTKATPVVSSWWGGGSSTYPTCLDKQLECRSVAGSETLFKLYKKEWFTCIWGNLWKECGMSEAVQKYENILDIEKKIEFKNKLLEKLYNEKNTYLININNTISEIDYLWDEINRNYAVIYTKWVNSLLKVESLIAEKNIESAKKELINSLNIFKNLSNYLDEFKIRSIDIDWKELKYLKYTDKKIQKIQILLFNKNASKKASTEVYVLANKVVHNLNKLLTDKTLTKDQIIKIRQETISIYKNYIKEYMVLPKN